MEASGVHRAAISSLLRYLPDVTQLTIYLKSTEVLQSQKFGVIGSLYVSYLACGCAWCETMVCFFWTKITIQIRGR